MKRRLALLLSIVLVIGLLSGCGKTQKAGTDQGSTAAPTSAAPQGKVTINYWHSLGAGVNGDAIKEYVAKFNEKNAGKIEVIETYQGAYADATPKIMQAIAAKTQPELVMVDTPRLPQFIDLGATEDLRPYLVRDKVDDKDFLDGLMTYARDGEKIQALPVNRSTPILYYNKDMFKAAGLDASKGPANWTDMVSYAEKLTKKEGGKTTVYGMSWQFDFHWFVSAWALEQGSRALDEKGKTMTTAKDGTLLKALKMWDGMNKAGTFQQPAATNAQTVMFNSFYQKQLGMMIASTGSLGNILQNTAGKFEVGTAYLPADKQFGVATGGGSVFITKQSDKVQKDAAWEFLKYLTSTEVAADYSVRSGYLPTRKSCVETDTIKKLWAEKPQYKVAYDQLQYAKDTFRTPNMTELHNEGNKIFQAMIVEQSITPEQAVKEIDETATRILNQ